MGRMWVECDSFERARLGFVRHTRSMSGKRIVLLSNTDIDSTVKTPKTMRHCSERKFQRSEKSLLEALPPLDILVSIKLVNG